MKAAAEAASKAAARRSATRSRAAFAVAAGALALLLVPLAGVDFAAAGQSLLRAVLDAYADRLYAAAGFIASCF